jgi:serine/threonine-protein kinase
LLGLPAAHDHGIPHRDYRPENVPAGRDGSSELIDFNVTGRAGARLAPYQAPEQRDGAPPSRASNLYAATAVFFECLTGLAPSPERIRRFRLQQLAVSALIGEATESLRGLMAWGMAANPADRPASATDLIVELNDMASAAYGPDWHRRARHDLAEKVAGGLTPVPGTAGNAGDRPLTSRLRSQGRVLYAAIASVVAVAILGAAGTAVALSGHLGSKPSHLASIASPGAPSGSASTSAVSGSSTVANSVPSGGKATFTARRRNAVRHFVGLCHPRVLQPADSNHHSPPTTTTVPATTASPTLTFQPNIDVQLITTNQLQPKTVLCSSTPLTFDDLAPVGRHFVRKMGASSAELRATGRTDDYPVVAALLDELRW